MNLQLYRSISNMRKETLGTINVNKGKYTCKIARKDIPRPFTFASSKWTLLEAIEAATSGPVILAKELPMVEYIDIKNYG